MGVRGYVSRGVAVLGEVEGVLAGGLRGLIAHVDGDSALGHSVQREVRGKLNGAVMSEGGEQES